MSDNLKVSRKTFAFYTVLIILTSFVLSALTFYTAHNEIQGIISVFAQHTLEAVGVLVVNMFSLAIVVCYLYKYSRERLVYKRYFIIVCLGVVITHICAMLSFNFLNAYIIPFTLAVIITVVLVDRRCGLVVCLGQTITIIADSKICHLMGAEIAVFTSTEFIAVLIPYIVCSALIVCAFKKQDTRMDLVLHGLSIAIISLPISMLCNMAVGENIADNISNTLWYGASQVVAIGLFMILLPLFEGVFNLMTTFRLTEFCTFRNPVLKRLFEEAPGTFNHSISVANLAEACAVAIGANAPLARAGAYYHDVGKLKNPECFIENQIDGVNIHDDMIPEASAKSILRHTGEGYAILKQYRFPSVIADIAREHHGQSTLMYFYNKAQKITEGEADVSLYTYDGPKPTTKESAIVMTCDSCEAAVRGQKDRDIDDVVADVIKDKIITGQYDDCPLTFAEISIIRDTITQSLAFAYHKRIGYNPKL